MTRSQRVDPDAMRFGAIVKRLRVTIAKHLGGRTEPWKKVEGTTAELR